MRVVADRGRGGFHRQQRDEGLRQLGEVPGGHIRLLVEGVAPAGVGMVADVTGVEGVEKTERAVVQRQSQNRHVVGVHYPVRKPHRLPLRHQLGGAAGDFAQQLGIGFGTHGQLRVIARNDVIGQITDRLDLVAVIKHLERAKADEAWRQPGHQRGGFFVLAVYRAITAYNAQRAGGGNAERVHRLGAQVFTDARTQHRAAIAAARVGRAPRALQLHFPAFAGCILHFAQQNRAAVAQLRHKMAELVPGIQRGHCVHPRQQLVAGQGFDQFGAGDFAFVQIEQAQRFRAVAHQIGSGHRRRADARIIGLGQTGETVVEGQRFKFGHGGILRPGQACSTRLAAGLPVQRLAYPLPNFHQLCTGCATRRTPSAAQTRLTVSKRGELSGRSAL